MYLFVYQMDTIIKLIISALIGALIGTEREFRNRSAGFRTHILVAMGSCLIMIISSEAFADQGTDPTRIAAQVVSGIGFLGAGSIMQGKGSVKGLTTAANIWVCGAIGLAIGAGMYKEAISATAIALIALTILNTVAKRFFKKIDSSIEVHKEVDDDLYE